MEYPSCIDNSFFEVFSFKSLMHDACDRTLVYGHCVITRDIKTKLGHELKIGSEFEQVNFDFQRREFIFVDHWVSSDPNNPNHWNRIPSHNSITISQKELAPYLVWYEKDLPKEG